MVNHILNQQNEKWRLWVEYPAPRQPSAKGPAEHLVTAQRRLWSSLSRIGQRDIAPMQLLTEVVG